MFRIFEKSGRQISFVRKCTFIQLKRTLAGKNSSDGEIDHTFSTLKGIKKRLKNVKETLHTWNEELKSDSLPWENSKPTIPKYCDIIIIGGGAIGSSIAYWLKKFVHKDFKVIVIEKDPTYASASTTLSVGGLRQQFSLQENIEMSLFGAEFIRNINDHLGIYDLPPIDPCFHPYGYLTLASEAGAETLWENSRLQNSLGAKNILLTADMLKNMFPWISTEGVEVGCLGLEKEGWFDPWTVLCAFKRKALYLGANYIQAKATGFILKDVQFNEYTTKKLNELVIETPDGTTESIQFAAAVVAAGAFSGEVAKMANIGTGTGILEVPLPVEPRKRYVYCFHCPDGPGLNTPLTIDPSGTYFRRDGLGGNFICGKSPKPDEEPSVEDLSVDHDYFNDQIWPILASRVKAFEKLKVKSAWAGYYEYNTFDENGIIGPHPYLENLYFATGFSGHGIQQAPAIGRAIAELILDKDFVTLKLHKLSFDRFVKTEPLLENCIV